MTERQKEQLEKEKKYSNLWFSEAENNILNNEKYLYPCIMNIDLEEAPLLPGSKGDKPFLSFKAQNLKEAKLILNYTMPDLTKRKKVEYGRDNYNFIDFSLKVSKKFNDLYNDEFKLVYNSKRFGIECWIELKYENFNNFKTLDISRSKVIDCGLEVRYSEKEITNFKGKTLKYSGTKGTIQFSYHNENLEEVVEMLKFLNLSEINTYK